MKCILAITGVEEMNEEGNLQQERQGELIDGRI